MPDPVRILEALAAAAVTAAAVLLLCAGVWRRPRPAWASAGGVLGVGLGFFIGCWWLGLTPRVPPREDLDRLLLLLFPAVVAVELAASVSGGRFRGLIWPLRVVVAAGAARVLLHHTTYLVDLAGPGTREWTPGQAWLILGGLAAALAGVWASLTLLVRRSPGRSVPLTLALTSAGAAVTVMLSGYATGGQVGLPLAAALTGAMLASLLLPGPPDVQGVLGLGVVGLFALLVIGRFFGELATAHAALLFFAPLLCWLPELPYVRRLGPRLAGLGRVVLVAVPVALALVLAQQRFAAESAPPSSGATDGPTIQDYLDFGK